ncbi:TPA: hypothetical protein ACGO3A_001308 [Streptococcus suis]
MNKYSQEFLEYYKPFVTDEVYQQMKFYSENSFAVTLLNDIFGKDPEAFKESPGHTMFDEYFRKTYSPTILYQSIGSVLGNEDNFYEFINSLNLDFPQNISFGYDDVDFSKARITTEKILRHYNKFIEVGISRGYWGEYKLNDKAVFDDAHREGENN